MKEPMKLTDGNATIELPIENFLRVFFIHAKPLASEYQQTTGKTDIAGFFDWLKIKLEIGKGKVLG